MLELRNKCNFNEYDIEIESELNYEDGYGLIERLLGCININSIKPQGHLSISFRDWDYYFPITKEDNLRIRELLKDWGYDRQYVEDLYEYCNSY